MKEIFNECTGIRSWHAMRIESEGPNILVSNHVTNPYNEYKIMEEDRIMNEEMPSVIEPEGLSNSRVEQLKYFTNYITRDHCHFILDNY